MMRAPVEECRLRTVRRERWKIKKALRGYVRRSDRMIAVGVVVAGLLISVGIIFWTAYTMAGWR